MLAANGRQISSFRVADLHAQRPGVGLDLIRQILSRLQKEGKVKALGTGRSARWERLGNYKLLLPSKAELKAELLRELKGIGPTAVFRSQISAFQRGT